MPEEIIFWADERSMRWKSNDKARYHTNQVYFLARNSKQAIEMIQMFKFRWDHVRITCDHQVCAKYDAHSDSVRLVISTHLAHQLHIALRQTESPSSPRILVWFSVIRNKSIQILWQCELSDFACAPNISVSKLHSVTKFWWLLHLIESENV